jgi:hypothetical protein
MKEITHQLPPVIQDHIRAYNTPDPELMIRTLAPDALLNDNKREFLGHDAIRAWAAKEIFGDKVTLDVQAAYEHYGSIVVRCKVDGTFDKSKLPNPFILTYYFQIQNNLITQIIILLNSVLASR